MDEKSNAFYSAWGPRRRAKIPYNIKLCITITHCQTGTPRTVTFCDFLQIFEKILLNPEIFADCYTFFDIFSPGQYCSSILDY